MLRGRMAQGEKPGWRSRAGRNRSGTRHRWALSPWNTERLTTTARRCAASQRLHVLPSDTPSTRGHNMRFHNHSLHSSSLPALAAALLVSALAPAALSAQDSVADADAAADEPEDAIVVTGSRIARDPNIGAPAPIISVTAEELQRSGTADVVDTLRDIPALSTSTSTEGSIDGVFSQAVGQSILNLRGLGSNRTLVLVNGRRHVSGVAGEQAVDINSIPSALIERVEDDHRRCLVGLRRGRGDRRGQLRAEGGLRRAASQHPDRHLVRRRCMAHQWRPDMGHEFR